VAQMVEKFQYKPEGRRFDFHQCHWNFSLTSGRTMALGSTQPLTEMNTRNIYLGGDKSGRHIRLTTLSSSCAYYLEM